MVSITLESDVNSKSGEEIRAGLLTFNEKFTGTIAQKYTVVATENNKIIGGAVSYHDFDSVYVDLLWLDDPHRGKGIGREIMQMVEAEAAKRGAKTCTLDTFDFQAEDFYSKLGYNRIGVIPEYLGKHDRIFMRKELI